MISVLYVDDETGLLEIGKAFLEMTGEFTVDTDTSAKHALEIIKQGRYDAVISDYQMPGMDGITFLKEVRKSGNTIPFIIFTGRGREEIVIQALNEGADFYLQKGGEPTAQFTELAHKIRLAVRERKAVAALEKSEERYRAVVEDQTEFICRFTPAGRLTFVNDAYCRYFGLDRERCLNEPHTVHLPPEDTLLMKSHLASLSPQNPAALIEHKILMPDGTVRWQRWNDRAIFSDKGRVIEYQSVGRDTTELWQAGEALRTAEETYRGMFLDASIGLFRTDMHTGLLLDANDAVARFIGFSGRDELLARPFNIAERYVDPADRETLITVLEQKGEIHNFEASFRRNDGEVRLMRYSARLRPERGWIEGVSEDITDRRKAEQALQESEEKYRTAIEKTHEAVIIAQDGLFVFANESMGRLAGMPPEDLIGKPFIDFIWPDDREMVRVRYLKRIAGEEIPDAYDFRVIGAGGRMRWVTISAARIPWQGRPATLNMLADITGRKQAEAELQEQKEKFAAAFIINPDPVAITETGTGAIIEANPAFSQVFGYSTDELTGKTTTELNLWADVKERDAILSLLQSHRDVIDHEIRFRTRSGKVGTALFSARFITIKEKEHLFTRMRDITDRRRTEEALKESEEQYRTLVEQASDVFYRQDMRTGRFEYVSPKFETLLGYTPDEMLAMEIDEQKARIHPDDLPALLPFPADLVSADSQGETVIEREFRIRHRQGGYRWIHGSYSLMRDDAGIPVRVIGSLHDITAWKKVEEALRESEEKYRAIVEQSLDGLIVHQNGNIVFANKTALDLIAGGDPEQVLGRPVLGFVHPEYHDIVTRRMDVGRGEVQPVIREKLVRTDGSIIDADVVAIPFTWNNKPAVYVIFRDVTRQVLAEEAVRQQSKNLAILNEVITTANRAQDLPSLLKEILHRTLSLMDYDAGGIYITDPAAKTATVVVSHNLPEEFLAKIRIVSISGAPYDTLLVQGTPIITEHYDQVSPEHARETGFCSLAGIPLVSGDRIIGAMNVVSKRRDVVTDRERDTLISIGRELGTTIDRIIAEGEAKRSAENLELLFNSVDDMVFILAMDGTILKVNDTVLKKLQFTRQEIIGNNVLSLHVPELRDEALRIVQDIVAGKVDSCPVPMLAKDGTRIEVETKATRGWWDNREVLIGVTRDITRRRQAEKALRESEEKFRSLVETTSDFIWEVDADAVYTYVSPQVHRILGFEPGEVLGKTPFDLMPPDEAERVAAEFHRCIAARIPIVTLENKALKKDGSVVIFETSGVPWTAPDGTFLGYRGIDRDITRRKQVEEALREKTHELGERIKEIRSLYEIARVIEAELPVDVCLRKFCEIIPSGWQFPDRTSVRIRVGDRTFCSPGFRESPKKITCAIAAGKETFGEIEVFSLGITDTPTPGPFLTEESDLLFAIAERIGRMLERVQVEAALARKTEELDLYFTTSIDLFCIADTRGYFLRLNPEWEKTLGYTLSKLEGRQFLDFVHPDDLQATRAAMEDLSSQKEVLDFTNRFRHKDGSYRWIEWRSHPRGEMIFSAARDITRHHIEEHYTLAISRLKQDLLISAPLEEKLRKITDACVSLFGADFARIWIAGPGDLCGAGCIHAAVTGGENACDNRSACLHLIVSSGRYTRTDGTHRRVPFGAYKIGRIGSGEDAWFIINDVLHDPRIHDPAWAGSLGLVSFAGFRLTSAEGKPIGVLAFFSRQEIPPDMIKYFDDLATMASLVIQAGIVGEALRESEEKYRSIIENSQDMLYRTDLEGRFTMVSPAGARLVGYTSPEELIGHAVSEHYLDPEDRRNFLEALKKTGSVARYPVTLKSADGSIHFSLASSHYYYDAHGNVLGVEGLVHDITDLHLAEEGLRMANKKLVLLSSITRHDIRNQLTALTGFLHLASDSSMDPAQRTGYLARAQQVARVIDRQITFTKDYEDMGIKAPAWQSIKACINEAVTSLPVQDVRINDETGGFEVFADPLLAKVFYNLIDNSRRYGGEKMTAITVSVREAEDGLVLTYLDDGAGIGEADRPNLFRRGFGKNTGLGLFLSREILAITGITIAENSEPGKGARFELQVPKGAYRVVGPGD
jgi:PAS domain S-box-containing protein